MLNPCPNTAPVGNDYDKLPSGRKDPPDLGQCFASILTMLQSVNHQQTIYTGIGQRQIFVEDQSGCTGFPKGPVHRALACRHEGYTAFTVAFEHVEIRCGIAETHQPFVTQRAPHGRQGLTDKTSGALAHRRRVKLAKINYVHMHR